MSLSGRCTSEPRRLAYKTGGRVSPPERCLSQAPGTLPPLSEAGLSPQGWLPSASGNHWTNASARRRSKPWPGSTGGTGL
jgi:hypothetical protein